MGIMYKCGEPQQAGVAAGSLKAKEAVSHAGKRYLGLMSHCYLPPRLVGGTIFLTLTNLWFI